MNGAQAARTGQTPRNAQAAQAAQAAHSASAGAAANGTVATDALISRLAARQHGVVTRNQLVREGVSRHALTYRVKAGRLQCLYRGVYRVGPIVGCYEREMAALLACGEKAVLSHGTAAVIWGMLARHHGSSMPVHVSLRGNRVPGPGVRAHRVSALRPEEITMHEGLPLTIPARTLLDLASCVGSRELEQALALADRMGLVDRDGLELLLLRYPRRSGTRMLRALIAGSATPSLTRSEAEVRFLDLIRRGQLGGPEANAMVKGYEVDFVWRHERLIAEIDGFAYHSSSTAFERDRRRDADLTAAGFRVMRVTWRQLSMEPDVLLVRLAQALARSRHGENRTQDE